MHKRKKGKSTDPEKVKVLPLSINIIIVKCSVHSKIGYTDVWTNEIPVYLFIFFFMLGESDMGYFENFNHKL